MVKRLPRQQSEHDQTVRGVAEKRFNRIKYDVYVNPGSEKNAHIGLEADAVYPDIVVLEKGHGQRTAIAIGEVETSESINEDEAEQWLEYSATKIPFYLYIPAGYDAVVTQILNNKGIRISGLRTFKYGYLGELIIAKIY